MKEFIMPLVNVITNYNILKDIIIPVLSIFVTGFIAWIAILKSNKNTNKTIQSQYTPTLIINSYERFSKPKQGKEIFTCFGINYYKERNKKLKEENKKNNFKIYELINTTEKNYIELKFKNIGPGNAINMKIFNLEKGEEIFRVFSSEEKDEEIFTTLVIESKDTKNIMIDLVGFLKKKEDYDESYDKYILLLKYEDIFGNAYDSVITIKQTKKYEKETTITYALYLKNDEKYKKIKKTYLKEYKKIYKKRRSNNDNT